MNNQTAYWLWIQQAIGYGSNKILHILEKFTFAEDFYRASLSEKLMCGCFTQKDIDKLNNTSLESVSRIMRRCDECEIDIITIGDVAYPDRLMNIYAPPAAIFVKGNREVLSDEFSVAMVGTRSATPYGMRSAFKFGFDLAKNGVTVVSGGALGIDTYSHRGALQANGKTICVLGCGISYKYLRENDEMKKQILRKGAVISEYPPDVSASRFTFPQRNRIISGLSKGVLIIEAGKKSGSLITARLALEQNRDVFAVPGEITSNVSFGTNELIKEGAVPVTLASDIIEYYCGDFHNSAKEAEPPVKQNYEQCEQLEIFFDAAKPKREKPEIPQKVDTNVDKSEIKTGNISSLPKISEKDYKDLSENVKKVLLSFDCEQLHIDSLAEKSGLSIKDVNSAVTQLEMYGYIESLQGRNYKILVSIK